MRDAMRHLGKVYGVKDQNTFLQILLAGTANEKEMSTTDMEAGETNTALSLLADAIISLRGDGVFSHQFQEIIDTFISDAAAGLSLIHI